MPEDPHPPSSSAPSGGGRLGSSSSGRPAAWEPPSPEELQKLLPKYEVTTLLGKGGMGAVYKGIQRSLERQVAIKILSSELDEREMGFAERFKNEAKAMAKLNHPGIVGVHDFGEAPGGILFIGMEFVAGTDVARMLAKKGLLPPDHALAITAHVCDALAYAHQRGIIHRDIKPANIMVGYDGVVKVADFGLAKMSQAADSGLTQSGVAMGTMHYMAPEALTLGSAVDHRADIYAVGVMLYQMLTGKIPRGMFDPPSKLVPGLDPRFDQIIVQAIRNERELRYQGVMELRADLDSILTRPVERVVEGATEAPAALPTAERPVQTKPRTRQAPAARPEEASLPAPRKSGALSLVVVMAGLVVLLVAGWLLMHRPASSTQEADTAQASDRKVGAAANSPPKTPAPPRWPTGPNFRSAGRFRAWSSVPNDPAIDLSLLASVGAAKQVHMKADGWIVLLPDGEVRSNYRPVEKLPNIRRICPGWDNCFGLIDREGRLTVYPPAAASTETPEGMGPVKDAYISPHHRAALLEDGSLVVWGRGYDGVNEKGNPEWLVKPSLPAGRKAVAIYSSDNTFAVKLDDGSLRVWSVAGGLIPPPAEFAADKVGELAINRVDLFGVPQDGGPALRWGLNGKSKAGTFPKNPLGARLIETNHGMLALDKDGRPHADKLLSSLVPGASAALAAVPRVREELISAYLSTRRENPPHTARMLWLDESAPLPAAEDRDWPEDGPYFGREGRFKAWSSVRYDRALDLSRLRGIDDAVQVYQGSGNWVVLRSNGDTITSDGAGDRKGIRRICPGNGQTYALISRDGSVEVIAPNLASLPEFLTPPGLKATDAFISPSNWALAEDGGIVVWGRNFDGKTEVGNGEWQVKPVLPQGRKAVAIAHSEFVLGVQVENQSLLLWRGGGPVKLPATLRSQKFSHFALTNQTLFGVLADGGLPVMWTSKDAGLKPVPGLRSAASVQEAGKSAVVFFTATGKPTPSFQDPFDKTVFDPVLSHVDAAAPDLCSFRTDYNAKDDACFGRMLWFDSKAQPSVSKVATAAPKPSVSEAKASTPRPLDQLPEFRTRVLNYQKARHAQLGDLAGKYRHALTNARGEATKSGARADVAELDAAIARTAGLVTAIEKNLASLQVGPLPVLAPLGSQVPKSLQDLRAIFDRELKKIEASLAASLDQSLLHVQTQLVKNRDIPTAKQVEAFRKDLLAGFSG